MLQALAASGRQGGTVQELRDFVAAREAACMEANTNTTITRLVGAGRTIQAELSQARIGRCCLSTSDQKSKAKVHRALCINRQSWRLHTS